MVQAAPETCSQGNSYQAPHMDMQAEGVSLLQFQQHLGQHLSLLQFQQHLGQAPAASNNTEIPATKGNTTTTAPLNATASPAASPAASENVSGNATSNGTANVSENSTT